MFDAKSLKLLSEVVLGAFTIPVGDALLDHALVVAVLHRHIEIAAMERGFCRLVAGDDAQTILSA